MRPRDFEPTLAREASIRMTVVTTTMAATKKSSGARTKRLRVKGM